MLLRRRRHHRFHTRNRTGERRELNDLPMRVIINGETLTLTTRKPRGRLVNRVHEDRVIQSRFAFVCVAAALKSY